MNGSEAQDAKRKLRREQQHPSPRGRLDGVRVLITGAGGPMGFAIARRFAAEGASLALTDISGSRLEKAAAAVREVLAPGAALVAQRASVLDEEEVRGLIRAVEGAPGSMRGGQIDVLVNVVGGVRGPLDTAFVALTPARMTDTFDLNLKGTLLLAQALVPGMLARQRGKILNISSINMAGAAGQADYAMAKAAVASLTRTLAMELAPHVNVNCIAPAIINTSVVQRMPQEERQRYVDATQLKRMGEPGDIANAALFLCSSESDYITGVMLPVSGGIWPAL